MPFSEDDQIKVQISTFIHGTAYSEKKKLNKKFYTPKLRTRNPLTILDKTKIVSILF